MGKTAGIQDRHADPLPGKSGRFLLMSLNICLIHINYLYPSSVFTIRVFRETCSIDGWNLNNFFRIYLNNIHTFSEGVCYTKAIRDAELNP